MLIEDVGTLYKYYYDDLYKYIYFMTFNAHDTEDILQNVFIKVLKSRYFFQGRSKIKTWIFSIAHNECINYLNKNSKTVCFGDCNIIIKYPEDSVEEKVLNKQAVEQVMRFIHSNKEPVRSLLILRLIEEKSFIEIGNIINKSDTWCRVTFFRAKKNLISYLEKNEEDVKK